MKTSTKFILAIPPLAIVILAAVFWDSFSLTEEDQKPPVPETPLGEMTPPTPPEAAGQELPLNPAETPASAPQGNTETTTAVSEQHPTNVDRESRTEQDSPKQFADLSGNPIWQACCRHPDAQLIFVKAVEQLAGGNRPLALAEFNAIPAPAPFSAVEKDGTYTLSPETEQRFSPVIDALLSVPPEEAGKMLRNLYPALDSIVTEKLGYPPETTFKTLYVEALTMLLTTPVPETPLQLVRLNDRLYKYAIPELEALPHAQKFILRLGLGNQAKLRSYAETLWKQQ